MPEKLPANPATPASPPGSPSEPALATSSAEERLDTIDRIFAASPGAAERLDLSHRIDLWVEALFRLLVGLLRTWLLLLFYPRRAPGRLSSKLERGEPGFAAPTTFLLVSALCTASIVAAADDVDPADGSLPRALLFAIARGLADSLEPQEAGFAILLSAVAVAVAAAAGVVLCSRAAAWAWSAPAARLRNQRVATWLLSAQALSFCAVLVAWAGADTFRSAARADWLPWVAVPLAVWALLLQPSLSLFSWLRLQDPARHRGGRALLLLGVPFWAAGSLACTTLLAHGARNVAREPSGAGAPSVTAHPAGTGTFGLVDEGASLDLPVLAWNSGAEPVLLDHSRVEVWLGRARRGSGSWVPAAVLAQPDSGLAAAPSPRVLLPGEAQHLLIRARFEPWQVEAAGVRLDSGAASGSVPLAVVFGRPDGVLSTIAPRTRPVAWQEAPRPVQPPASTASNSAWSTPPEATTNGPPSE
jgi:hypothetical protein